MEAEQLKIFHTWILAEILFPTIACKNSTDPNHLGTNSIILCTVSRFSTNFLAVLFQTHQNMNLINCIILTVIPNFIYLNQSVFPHVYQSQRTCINHYCSLLFAHSNAYKKAGSTIWTSQDPPETRRFKLSDRIHFSALFLIYTKPSNNFQTLNQKLTAVGTLKT